jgi:hypothetical protein
LPKTTLFVVLIRFNFFYWIWYYHTCDAQLLQEGFKPDPQYTKGCFTFKPTAARDKLKIDQALSELLLRTSREMVSWTKQLGDYAVSRMGSLRQIGPIIE